jgi:hypothetical protein
LHPDEVQGVAAAPPAPEGQDWTPTYKALPDEERAVEVAVLDGRGRVYRAFGCRYDPGEGWVWALAHGPDCEDADDCDMDDDYDVFAWREPTALPSVPDVRRFKVTRDRGDDHGEEVVGIFIGRDAAQAKMAEIGEAGRWEELPPDGDAIASDTEGSEG